MSSMNKADHYDITCTENSVNTNDLIHLDKDVGHMYIYSKYDMNVVIDL